MSRLSRGVLLVVLVLALTMGASLAWALNPNPQVLPPSTPYGMTYGQWGAAWWQWVTLGTPDNLVLLDKTGASAQVNQIVSGPVFFLAGTWTGSAEVRTINVPAGKAFFFPIFNWVLTYPEDVPLANRNSEQEAEAFIRKTLNDTFNGVKADNLVCVVDGAAVKNPLTYRAQSPAFSMYYPADSYEVLVDHSLITGDAYQAGLHYPTVSDGYWMMLAPLSTGLHTVQILAGPPEARWQDVTYNLTVVP